MTPLLPPSRRAVLGAVARLGLLPLAACLGPSADPGSGIRATRLPLAAGVEAGTPVGSLVFRGALQLTSLEPGFGGLSGLAVTSEGHAIAASDEGYFVEFDLIETADGTLVGVEHGRVDEMCYATGTPLRGKVERDAEELILQADGTRLVVFERHVRIGVFPPGSARASQFIELPGLVPSNNQGIEAAVQLPDGRFLLIAEWQGATRGVRDGWIGQPGAWDALTYVPPTNDDVSGAALLPNGDLLVLERWASYLSGFKCRLCRVPAASLVPGGRLLGQEILRLAPPFLSDNYEGVAVRQVAGRTSVYLVVDDNFFPFQRTLLLKFDLASG